MCMQEMQQHVLFDEEMRPLFMHKIFLLNQSLCRVLVALHAVDTALWSIDTIQDTALWSIDTIHLNQELNQLAWMLQSTSAIAHGMNHMHQQHMQYKAGSLNDIAPGLQAPAITEVDAQRLSATNLTSNKQQQQQTMQQVQQPNTFWHQSAVTNQMPPQHAYQQHPYQHNQHPQNLQNLPGPAIGAQQDVEVLLDNEVVEDDNQVLYLGSDQFRASRYLLLSVCLSVCLSLSLSLSLSFSHSFSLCLFLSLSLSLSLFVVLSLYLSFSLFLSSCLFVFLSLSLSLRLSLSVCLSRSLTLALSSLPLCACAFAGVCLCLCRCLCLCLCGFVCAYVCACCMRACMHAHVHTRKDKHAILTGHVLSQHAQTQS